MLRICLIAFLVLSSPSFAQRIEVDSLVPEMPAEGRRLASGFTQALDFGYFLGRPEEALRARRAWHREGWRYTRYLLRALDGRSESERAQLVTLLGGTHDDRAAVALLELLRKEPPGRVQWAIWAALAELGYYTECHAKLLLDGVKKGHKEPTGHRAWHCALLLAIIHHPEAVWAQDQLYEQHLVDGGLSEQTGPLLRFRDRALGRK